MRRSIALLLVVALMVFLFAGCATEPVVETTAPTKAPPPVVKQEPTSATTEPTIPTTTAPPETTTPPETAAPETTAPATTAPTEPEETQPKGTTYILNTNTKKFHYPSCSSADDIKATNRDTYVGTRQELIDRGYSPCGRCDP